MLATISSFSQSSYQKNLNGGLIASTNGFGFTLSSSLSPFTAAYQKGLHFEFQTLRTINETVVQNPNTINPKQYVLGKVNSAGTLRIGYYISKRLNTYTPNTQNLQLGICFGPSIGILKPYYIRYLDPKVENRQALIIVQNDETLANQENIYGPTTWTRGFKELTYELGLHADIQLSANKHESCVLKQWTAGARADLFPQGITILYRTTNRSFYSIYLSYKLGSKPKKNKTLVNQNKPLLN